MRKLPAGWLLLGLVAVLLPAAAFWVGPPGARADRPAGSAAGHARSLIRRHRGRPTVIIRWTSYGVPHIWATTYFGAGEGYGYAFAHDNICTIANAYVTVDAQRSRFFGPHATYTMPLNGTTVSNLDSDFFFQQIIDSRIIDKLLARRPPFGPVPQVKQIISGYVNGYNRYLRSVGGSRGVPDPRCRGKRWVRPITTAEVYRRIYQVVELASGDIAMQGIAEAAPPTAARGGSALLGAGEPSLDPRRTAKLLVRRLREGGIGVGGIGSNAVAVGSAGTRDHRHGVLLANPHFTWVGDERVYQAQITVPGQMDVEGASLYGLPAINIGHTATMAWGATASKAFRFTLFQLTLAPGSPTTYLYDGHPEQMTSRKVTVEVHQPDGSLTPVTRTLYSTRFGSVLNSLQGVALAWTSATTFAFGDANAGNFRVLNTFFGFGRARSAPQMLRILEQTEGDPWFNTLVADKTGHALFADVGAVPNVSNALASRCNTPLGAYTFSQVGLPILDGSRSACNWGTDKDAIEPGLFGPSHLPHLFRSDYVTNSNDSYWLSNPHQPLTGYARVIGDVGTPRSLRTRIGLIMTQARVSGTDGLGPAGFTVKGMENMVFSNRQYAGELWRDPLVALCRSLPGGLAPTSSGIPVAAGDACSVLAHWDRHENLDSHGAVLFRRFVDHAMGDKLSPFSQPFNVNDPVHTPSGLNTGDPGVSIALGDAIQDLEGAHIPLDATPGDAQAVVHDGVRIPIHGGPGDPNGEFNAIGAGFTPGKGFGPILGGSSFVQVVSWNNGPCPTGGSILTYSQSDNPASPHFDDQTKLFSQKRWVPDRFCMTSVLRDTKRTMVLERAR
jgi:acyl-homoserine-lactone acylase